MKRGSRPLFSCRFQAGLNARDGRNGGLWHSQVAYFPAGQLMNAEAKGGNVVTSVVVPSTIDTPLEPERHARRVVRYMGKAKAIGTIHFHCTGCRGPPSEPVIRYITTRKEWAGALRLPVPVSAAISRIFRRVSCRAVCWVRTRRILESIGLYPPVPGSNSIPGMNSFPCSPVI